MYKSNFGTLLDSFIKKDPSLAIQKDDEVKLTPAQGAMKGLTDGLNEGVNDKYVVPAEEPTSGAMGSGRTEPDSLAHSAEEEGYDTPITQDISLGDATPTPRTGATIGQMSIDPMSQPITPRPTLDESLSQAQQDRIDAENAPIKKQKWWKDAIAYAIQGANAAFNPSPDNKIEGFGKIKHDQEIRKVQGKLAPLMQQKEFNTKIENVETDNKLQRDALIQKANEATEKRKTLALGKLAGMQTFSNKNPAHAALAKESGRSDEEIAKMGTWDFRNPVKSTINGQQYDYDRTTGAWQPSGLPASEKDKLMDFEVSVPGEKNNDGTQRVRKFRIPQEKAAAFSKDLQAAGMQIEAAANRQEDAQKHDLEKQQIASELSKAIADHNAMLDEIKAEKDQTRKLELQTKEAASRENIVRLQKSLSGSSAPNFNP